MVEERRKEQRYFVREGALAFVGTTAATITDISRSGMGLKVIDFDEQQDRDLTLDIFFADDGFFLPDVPATLVTEHVVPKAFHFSFLSVCRLGVRFGTLTSEQEKALTVFVQHNVVAEA